MIESVDIREWRTRNVLDSDGRRIGSMEAVYVDTKSDEPAVATITVGMPTRRRLVFVPLNGAVVGPDYVKIAYHRSQVKDAPSMGTDDVLAADDEQAIFTHYGLPYQPPVGGERQLARR